MQFEIIGFVATAVAAYALLSQRLARSPVSGPMYFTAVGFVGITLVTIQEPVDVARVAAWFMEATLALVLFTDAMTRKSFNWMKG